MKPKISLLLVAFLSSAVACASNESHKKKKAHQLKDALASVLPESDSSIWKSFPVKSNGVNIQVLDKISGKVFRSRLDVDQPIQFGTISIILEKAFVNSPDDIDEVYAYIKIKEKGKIIFRDWLFASSPSVNLLAHPVYDVRVEF